MSEHLFKTIVVATDGSATAAHAVEKAAELASLAGGDLKLVGAYDSGKDQQRLEAALVESVEGLRSSGLNVTSLARQGDPVDVVLTAATEFGADLIVVGSLGMKGVKRLVLAPVPDKISHRATCSVLVAHTTG